MHLSQFIILGSVLVFLPIRRHRHWSLATVNMETKQIYHKDRINGTLSDAGSDGGTILLKLLADMAKHTGADFDKR